MLEDFDARFKETERQIERSQMFAKIWFAFCALAGIGAFGFVIWSIVKTMSFYGVI